jgi:hypothetical protein
VQVIATPIRSNAKASIFASNTCQSVRIFHDIESEEAATETLSDIVASRAEDFCIANELTFEGVVAGWSAGKGFRQQ